MRRAGTAGAGRWRWYVVNEARSGPSGGAATSARGLSAIFSAAVLTECRAG